MSNCGMHRSGRRTQGKGRMPKGLRTLPQIPGDTVKSCITVILGWSAAKGLKDVSIT